MEGILQGIYWPRNPQATSLYRLVEDNFDELERVWDKRYKKQHGFWRPVIRHVVEQYLTCGDLRCGFARLQCPPASYAIQVIGSGEGVRRNSPFQVTMEGRVERGYEATPVRSAAAVP
jgi:hypothetical protein